MRVLFTNTKNTFSWLIRVFTRSEWNHVDILVDDDSILGAVTGYTPPWTFNGGVKITSLRSRTLSPSTHHYMLLNIDLPDESAALNFALDQVGKPYDWTSIFGMVFFRRRWQDPDKWFCSELVAAACVAGGLTPSQKASYRVTPGDLANSFLSSTTITVSP